MRGVAVKSMDQQATLMLHRVRDLLVPQRTMLIHALRGHLAEFGIVTARGPAGVKAAIVELHAMQDSLPPLAKMAFKLIDRLESVGEEIRKMERRSSLGVGITMPAGGWRQSRESGRSPRARSRRRCRICRCSDRAGSSRLGSV
jgi:transposase